jgi:hypothetical protein
LPSLAETIDLCLAKQNPRLLERLKFVQQCCYLVQLMLDGVDLSFAGKSHICQANNGFANGL